jgi:hypothetical protein
MKVYNLYFLFLFVSCHSTNQKLDNSNKVDSIGSNFKNGYDVNNAINIKSGDTISKIDTINLGNKKIILNYKYVALEFVADHSWTKESLEFKIYKSDIELPTNFLDELKNRMKYSDNCIYINDFNLDGLLDIGIPSDGCGRYQCYMIWLNLKNKLVYWSYFSNVPIWGGDKKTRIVVTGDHLSPKLSEIVKDKFQITNDTAVSWIYHVQVRMLNDTMKIVSKRKFIRKRWINSTDTLPDNYEIE